VNGEITHYILRNYTKKHKLRKFYSQGETGVISGTFYNLDEIRKNGYNARQQMEKRALNAILTRLVNHPIEWL